MPMTVHFNDEMSAAIWTMAFANLRATGGKIGASEMATVLANTAALVNETIQLLIQAPQPAKAAAGGWTLQANEHGQLLLVWEGDDPAPSNVTSLRRR